MAWGAEKTYQLRLVYVRQIWQLDIAKLSCKSGDKNGRTYI